MSNSPPLDIQQAQALLAAFKGQVLPHIESNVLSPPAEQSAQRSLDVTQAQRVLTVFKTLQFPQPQRQTLLEILGKSQREVVNSNILKFFLDTTAAHGLNDLVLQALCRCLQLANMPIRRTKQVNTEVVCKGTQQAGRIDLVVEMDDALLIIENKLFHHAKNNPFDSYIQHCDERWPEQDKHYILLGLDCPDDCHGQFTFISHFHLVQEIRKEISGVLGHADHYYMTLLIDYLNTVDNLNPQSRSGKMEQAIVQFYQDNKDTIQAILDNVDYVKKHYAAHLMEVYAALQNQEPTLSLMNDDGAHDDNDAQGSFAGCFTVLMPDEQYIQDENFKIRSYLFANLTEYGFGVEIYDQNKKGAGKNNFYPCTLDFLKQHHFDFEEREDDNEIYLVCKKGQSTVEQFVADVLPVIQRLDGLLVKTSV